MIFCALIISLGLASARSESDFALEQHDALRTAAEIHQEFAEVSGIQQDSLILQDEARFSDPVLHHSNYLSLENEEERKGKGKGKGGKGGKGKGGKGKGGKGKRDVSEQLNDLRSAEMYEEFPENSALEQHDALRAAAVIQQEFAEVSGIQQNSLMPQDEARFSDSALQHSNYLSSGNEEERKGKCKGKGGKGKGKGKRDVSEQLNELRSAEMHDEFPENARMAEILMADEQARQGLNFKQQPSRRWPDNQIPYEIYNFTVSEMEAIEMYVQEFNDDVENVKLVKRRRYVFPQDDYITIVNGVGCSSDIGKMGGQQILSLESGKCLSPGKAHHEFMHAAGLVDEHNRSDRDEYIKINYENIPPEYLHLYEKVSSEEYEALGPYDFYSLTHAPIKVPNSDKPAFTILEEGVEPDDVGQESEMTDFDIEKLNNLYS